MNIMKTIWRVGLTICVCAGMGVLAHYDIAQGLWGFVGLITGMLVIYVIWWGKN
jgi:hypothetical protein